MTTTTQRSAARYFAGSNDRLANAVARWLADEERARYGPALITDRRPGAAAIIQAAGLTCAQVWHRYEAMCCDLTSAR